MWPDRIQRVRLPSRRRICVLFGILSVRRCRLSPGTHTQLFRRRPFDTYDAVFNVTVLDGIGFQIYFNAGTSCPSETSNTLTTSSADYATLAYLLTGGSGSSTEFDFTIGMMRVNASLPCEFTMYAFDGKNASLSTPPNMVCTQPLVALTQCNAAAFPQWEIIVRTCIFFFFLVFFLNLKYLL